MTSVIVGGRTDAQFADNLKAAELKLSAEEVARLDKVIATAADLPLLAPELDGPRAGSGEADLALHQLYLEQ